MINKIKSVILVLAVTVLLERLILEFIVNVVFLGNVDVMVWSGLTGYNLLSWEINIFTGTLFRDSPGRFFDIQVIRLLHLSEKVQASNRAFIILVNRVVFHWVVFIAENVLCLCGMRMNLLAEFWSGFFLLQFEIVLCLYFFHYFVSDIFPEGSFGLGRGWEERLNCFHCFYYVYLIKLTNRYIMLGNAYYPYRTYLSYKSSIVNLNSQFYQINHLCT